MDTAAVIPYELHITLEGLKRAEEAGLIGFCAEHDARLLLIELARGISVSQPMFSKVIDAAGVEQALAIARRYAALLQSADYHVSRLKLEVPATYAAALIDLSPATVPYYEWHGRITYSREEALQILCRIHTVHLSRNALRTESDRRFITLREYGNAAAFEQRLTALKQDLDKGSWILHKEQSEYCIYDNNISLDEGWLI